MQSEREHTQTCAQLKQRKSELILRINVKTTVTNKKEHMMSNAIEQFLKDTNAIISEANADDLICKGCDAHEDYYASLVPEQAGDIIRANDMYTR